MLKEFGSGFLEGAGFILGILVVMIIIFFLILFLFTSGIAQHWISEGGKAIIKNAIGL